MTPHVLAAGVRAAVASTVFGLALLVGAPALANVQTAPAASPPAAHQAAPAAQASAPGGAATAAPAAGRTDGHQPSPAATPAATPAAAPHDASAPAAAGAQPSATPATPDAGHAAPSAPVEAGHGQTPAAADAHGAAQPAAGHAAAAESHGEEHAESPWGLIARLFNFVVLIGALWYFLRGPIGTYLTSRSQQIRNDLVTAKDTTATATRQLAEIDQKLNALPAELAELKKRGAEEIAAEEARIKQTAEAERHRLLEQTRREIELQVRIAKRDLTDYAATLAVDLASDRIKQTATPDDQQRLIDRYVTQVRSAHD